MFAIPFFFACEFIYVLECVIDPASVPTQFILPIAYCLYICRTYCPPPAARAPVPAAARLPDPARPVATPCGVFCAPHPVAARQPPPRAQQARNPYSRPVRRPQNQGQRPPPNPHHQIFTTKFPPSNFHHQMSTIIFHHQIVTI